MGVVVAVVVVGVCIVVGGWLALGGRNDEIATAPGPGRMQAPRLEPPRPTPWWVRVRSGVLLTALSVTIGVAAAVGVGLVLVVLLGLLRASVG